MARPFDHTAVAASPRKAYSDSMQILRKLFAGLVLIILLFVGLWLYATHGRSSDKPLSATEGKDITLADPAVQQVPSVAIPSVIGWAADEAPQAARGMRVNRFATGLDHPRVMLALPNGDIVVAEADHPGDRVQGNVVMAKVKHQLYKQAGAGGTSPNTLILLRDGNGDGVAEQRFTLRQAGLDSPSGLAWGDDTLYVANHDAVLAFAYTPGQTTITAKPKKLMDLPPAGNHWMRNLLLSPDGKQLYVAVGSASNIAEDGIEQEKGRAAIWQIDLATLRTRQFASGMRNPNGLDWNPATGELWSTVVERDMLGPDLVPDYLTNVPIGAQYGWPWYYWQKVLDERVNAPMPIYLNEYIRRPEYGMGAHASSLGMRFAPAGSRLGPQFVSGAFVARHGSWNRKPPSGYDVVFIRFDANGNPQGMPVPVLTGFLKDKGHVHGRPAWVAFDRTGGLLVTDDTAGIVWRVIVPGAPPSPGVKPVVTGHLPKLDSINGANEAEFRRKFEQMMARDR
ncbi:MAG: hypothetical protein RLZZ136_721 [Pseudomonadota bacterium]